MSADLDYIAAAEALGRHLKSQEQLRAAADVLLRAGSLANAIKEMEKRIEALKKTEADAKAAADGAQATHQEKLQAIAEESEAARAAAKAGADKLLKDAEGRAAAMLEKAAASATAQRQAGDLDRAAAGDVLAQANAALEAAKREGAAAELRIKAAADAEAQLDRKVQEARAKLAQVAQAV